MGAHITHLRKNALRVQYFIGCIKMVFSGYAWMIMRSNLVYFFYY